MKTAEVRRLVERVAALDPASANRDRLRLAAGEVRRLQSYLGRWRSPAGWPSCLAQLLDPAQPEELEHRPADTDENVTLVPRRGGSGRESRRVEMGAQAWT
jgi:hypothetical protein